MTHSRAPTIAVIGAGIAGLTAAYRLSQAHDADGRRPRVVMFEASERVGGSIETVHREGFVVERGPDSMITEKPWGVELCREIGLSDALLPTNTASRGSFIVRGHALAPVPEGFHLMAPSRLVPFACSRLLGWKGKLRLALEPLVPPHRDGTDESVASFVRRRLGDEALVRIAQPMIGGIYTADPERLSLRATFPRFLEMEREYGSVVRGLVAARRRRDSGVAGARGPRYQLFVSLREGMEQLPKQLTALLPRDAIRLRAQVHSLVRTDTAWRIESTQGAVDADGVVMALPAYSAGLMLAPIVPIAATELSRIEYASTATVSLAYRRSDVKHPLDGFGFVVPAVEGRTVLACTFSSVKFPNRAPAGFVLMRAFVGGALFPDRYALDDASMVQMVENDLRDLLGVSRPALWTLVSRYPRSMPQYEVGHLERLQRIEAALAAVPCIALAGNAYSGAGIPDTVCSANRAAERLAAALLLAPPLVTTSATRTEGRRV